MSTSAAPNQPARPWLSRHWLWFVPTMAVAAAVFLLGFFVVVTGNVKSSEVHQLALARVQASPAVAVALGTPLTEGFLVKGNVHVSGPSGQAQLEIPLQGPKGSATVYVAAEKTKGVWHFGFFTVQPAGARDRIDLSDPQGAR